MSKINENLHLVDLREQLRDARRRPGLGVWMAVLVLGAAVALNAAWVLGSVRPRLAEAEAAVQAAHAAGTEAAGETALVRLQNDNLLEIIDFSSRYRIPADLAQAIHSIAISEYLDPDMAFRLVETESSFRRNALSEAGAVGYTQILPSTAKWLDPSVDETRLSALGLEIGQVSQALAAEMTLRASHQWPGGKGDVRDEMVQILEQLVDEMALLASGGLGATAIHALLREAPALDPAKIRWDVPVARPGKILCLGKNFVAHARSPGARTLRLRISSGSRPSRSAASRWLPPDSSRARVTSCTL